MTESWLTPIHDAASMREADRWAIESREIPSLELMEAAGAALARAAEQLARPGPVQIVCGKGNNGGDGLVAGRLLAATGYEVEVLLLADAGALSADAAVNLERFAGPARTIGSAELGAALAGSGLVIDAIFGTGFDGAPREPAAAAIEAINAADAPVLACDIASGVDASTGAVAGAAVEADLTVSFHAAKVGHWIAPGKWYTGRLQVAEIGIPPGAPVEPVAGLIGTGILALAPRRDQRSTKFGSGEVLVVGGSRGLTGAVCMAAQAAIRAGAGYATVAAPRSLEPILEEKLTEVMTLALAEHEGALDPEACAAVLERAPRAGCVVLGPGLGRTERAAALVRELAPQIEAPLLIDADGLNALAGDPEALAARSHPSILTPHAGEAGRLLGSSSDQVSAARLASAGELARRAGAIVVLKGDDSIVLDGDRVAINATASPSLATAGTGDVLSGTVAALIARGMDPFEGACAGVLAHARAGRAAAERVGAESVIATDVIDALPSGLRA